MAQIRSGTAVVTNGSTTITGVNVDWSTVSVNSIFVVANRDQTYLVTNTNYDSGTQVWTATIERPYGETSSDSAGLPYAIHVDFSPALQLPMIATGDIMTAAILARAFQRIDAAVSTGGSGGGSVDISLYIPGNTFVIGTALYVKSDGTYDIGTSGDLTKSVIVGIVSNVDGSNVKLRFGGVVSGLTGLTAGTVYYLKGGSATATNWSVLSGVGLAAIPLFIALDSASAFIYPLGARVTGTAMTGATSSTPGSAGVVPAPAAGDQAKVLSGAGTWVNLVPSAQSLLLASLALPQGSPPVGTVNADGTFTWPPTSTWGPLAISNLLFDLLFRANMALLRQSGDATTVTVWDGTIGSPTTDTATLPDNVAICLEVWGGGDCGRFGSVYAGGASGAYARALLLNTGGTLLVDLQAGLAPAGNTTTFVAGTLDSWIKRHSDGAVIISASGALRSLTDHAAAYINPAFTVDPRVSAILQGDVQINNAASGVNGRNSPNGGMGGTVSSIDGGTPGGGGYAATSSFGKGGVGRVRITY